MRNGTASRARLWWHGGEFNEAWEPHVPVHNTWSIAIVNPIRRADRLDLARLFHRPAEFIGIEDAPNSKTRYYAQDDDASSWASICGNTRRSNRSQARVPISRAWRFSERQCSFLMWKFEFSAIFSYRRLLFFYFFTHKINLNGLTLFL